MPEPIAKDSPNFVDSLARELKAPVVLHNDPSLHVRDVALPPGWTSTRVDDEALLPQPRHKRAAVTLDDSVSFINYCLRFRSDGAPTLWCQADYAAGKLQFTAILDDHAAGALGQDWRAHTARFAPRLSVEWQRWTGQHTKPMGQEAFAGWIEDNLRDIAGETEGFPTGGDMLAMSRSLEITQDSRFRSAVRLQSGGISLEYVETDDAATVKKMSVFERFGLGIPVFWNGSAYGLEARLRYRLKEGAVTFWYELIRADKVFEHAAREIIGQIQEETEMTVFFGDPRLI